MAHPAECHTINVTGTLNVLLAAHRHGIKRVVYASSAVPCMATHNQPAKQEGSIGKSLSPYGTSKHINEIYGQMMHSCFRECRQLVCATSMYLDPARILRGPMHRGHCPVDCCHAKWAGRFSSTEKEKRRATTATWVTSSRQNLLAATTDNPAAFGSKFNVGLGNPTSIKELFEMLQRLVKAECGIDVPPAIRRGLCLG